ncbi:hypothetical protein HPB48_002299 [Haemaphysalis longicornis]|uniref:Sulfotransferase domain-containing protein n=1 Tax=Haemaphysalis longicornis TaxID=44386 RepID=A0A9J6FJ06_HAELO|nr:hypothetical protein HPB48_002299 [Haemaphysalis longicornis]
MRRPAQFAFEFEIAWLLQRDHLRRTRFEAFCQPWREAVHPSPEASTGGHGQSPGYPSTCASRGFGSPASSARRWFRQALEFVPREGDVVLVTYPKCGTHWVQQILQLIVSGGPLGGQLLRMAGQDAAHRAARYVYVARNPWDCCKSFYHHTRTFPPADFHDGSFDDFLELFVSGQTDHGDFFDHVLPWYSLRARHNVLFITYEQLAKQPRDTVLDIARFFGPQLREGAARRPGALPSGAGQEQCGLHEEAVCVRPGHTEEDTRKRPQRLSGGNKDTS